MRRTLCFNGTKTFYMSKDQGKFGFSCHDPFCKLYFILAFMQLADTFTNVEHHNIQFFHKYGSLA